MNDVEFAAYIVRTEGCAPNSCYDPSAMSNVTNFVCLECDNEQGYYMNSTDITDRNSRTIGGYCVLSA